MSIRIAFIVPCWLTRGSNFYFGSCPYKMGLIKFVETNNLMWK
jgi:hypothetical protein